MGTQTKKSRTLNEVAHVFLSTWKKSDEKSLTSTGSTDSRKQVVQIKPPDFANTTPQHLSLSIISFLGAGDELPHSFVMGYRFLTLWRSKFSTLYICASDFPQGVRRSFSESRLFPIKQELRDLHNVKRYSLGGNSYFVYLPEDLLKQLTAGRFECTPATNEEAPLFGDTLCVVAYPQESPSLTRVVAPLIDKLVIVIRPSVDSLKEAYRRLKRSLQLNQSLELYLLIAGDTDIRLGEWLYARFSRLVSQFLNQTVTFLGFCPSRFFVKGPAALNNNQASFSMETLLERKPGTNLSFEKLGFAQELMKLKS